MIAESSGKAMKNISVCTTRQNNHKENKKVKHEKRILLFISHDTVLSRESQNFEVRMMIRNSSASATFSSQTLIEEKTPRLILVAQLLRTLLHSR